MGRSRMESRLENIEGKLRMHDARLNRIEEMLAGMMTQLTGVTTQLKAMTASTAQGASQMAQEAPHSAKEDNSETMEDASNREDKWRKKRGIWLDESGRKAEETVIREEKSRSDERKIKKKKEPAPVEEEIPGEAALQTSEAMHGVTTVEQQLLRQQSPLDKDEKAEVEDKLFKGAGLEEKHLWKDGEVWLPADPAKSQPLLQAQTPSPPPPPPPPLPHLAWSPPLLPFPIKQPPRHKPWESGSLVAKQPPPPPKPPDGNPQAAAGGTWTAKPPWACNGVPCLISEVDRWPRHMSAEEEAKARMAVLPCQASEEEKRKARMAERGMCIKDSALNLIDQTHIGLAETVEAQPMSHLRQNRKVKWVVNRGAEYLERYFLLIACAAYLGSKAIAGFCGQGESKTTLKNWLHQRPALQPQVNWVHLFEIMHEIAMKTTEESVRVEAVSIMNLVLLRSNAYNERDQFSEKIVFKTISKLLKKEAGLRMKKHILRLLHLILNRPKLLASFDCGCNEGGTK